jgi:hypothetical protein
VLHDVEGRNARERGIRHRALVSLRRSLQGGAL